MIVLRSTYLREREARIAAEAAKQEMRLAWMKADEERCDLTEKMLAMKRDGFSIVPEPPAREPAQKIHPDIRRAIETVTDPGTQEEADALALASRLMDGVQPGPDFERHVQTVAHRIIRGANAPEGVL